jgi:hypothetical protein
MTDKELKELQDIRKLLVLQLLASKVRAGDIAEVLGMDKGNFSRMFPVKKLSKNTK